MAQKLKRWLNDDQMIQYICSHAPLLKVMRYGHPSFAENKDCQQDHQLFMGRPLPRNLIIPSVLMSKSKVIKQKVMSIMGGNNESSNKMIGETSFGFFERNESLHRVWMKYINILMSICTTTSVKCGDDIVIDSVIDYFGMVVIRIMNVVKNIASYWILSRRCISLSGNKNAMQIDHLAVAILKKWASEYVIASFVRPQNILTEVCNIWIRLEYDSFCQEARNMFSNGILKKNDNIRSFIENKFDDESNEYKMINDFISHNEQDGNVLPVDVAWFITKYSLIDLLTNFLKTSKVPEKIVESIKKKCIRQLCVHAAISLF